MSSIDGITRIARLGIANAQRRGATVGRDALAEAEVHAEDGLEWLAEQSTYDPSNDAVASAREAVVEWVALKLSGGSPSTDRAFLTLAQSWTQNAARGFHRDDVAQILAEDEAMYGAPPPHTTSE